MKFFTLLLLSIFCSFAFSQKQKIDVDDDIITVDGVPYAKIEKVGKPAENFILKSLDGKDLIYMQYVRWTHPSKINNANKDGSDYYLVLTFVNDKQVCEIKPFMTKKGIAKALVEYDLIKDSTVIQENEDKMVLLNGTKYSQERAGLTGSGTTIIINNR